MRNSVVLRLASAAVLALMAGSVMSSPATAFVGLSDKQADEISEFIKCKTYLLKGDLRSFSADPDCGKGPVASGYLGAHGGGASQSKRHDCEWEWPSGSLLSTQSEGGDYCYPDYEDDYNDY